MIWVSTPSQVSTEHGRITRQGAASLMNLGTEPLLSNFAIDGYTTIFPLTLQRNADDLGAGLFAPTAGEPQAARVALANTSSATKVVALDFGNTPLARFTTVKTGSSFGGTSDKYTGRLETMAKGTNLHAPTGSNFGSAGSRLVVTLPANSAVTLTL